jgi:hypothetical protein
MKKNVIILSLLVFFAVGMVAQAPAQDKKACVKTEQKADCKKDKKDCAKDKADCDKKAACDKASAEKKGCCPTSKS